MALWVLGVLLAAVASFVSNLGINIQKLQHQKSAGCDGDAAYYKQPLWQLGLGLIIFGAISDFAALSFGPQSLIAPLGALTLVSQVVLAPVLLRERITVRDVLSILTIVVGAITSVIFGSHSEVVLTIDQLFDSYLEVPFLLYISLVILYIGGIYCSVRKMEAIEAEEGVDSRKYLELRSFHRFAYPSLSGAAGAQSVLFAKCTIELLINTFQGNGSLFLHPRSYLVLICMASTILLQVRWMNDGLARFDASYVVPVFTAFWILLSVMSGLVFYKEYAGMDATQMWMFAFGVLVTVTGVVTLSQRGYYEKQKIVTRAESSGFPLYSVQSIGSAANILHEVLSEGETPSMDGIGIGGFGIGRAASSRAGSSFGFLPSGKRIRGDGLYNSGDNRRFGNYSSLNTRNDTSNGSITLDEFGLNGRETRRNENEDHFGDDDGSGSDSSKPTSLPLTQNCRADIFMEDSYSDDVAHVVHLEGQRPRSGDLRDVTLDINSLGGDKDALLSYAINSSKGDKQGSRKKKRRRRRPQLLLPAVQNDSSSARIVSTGVPFEVARPVASKPKVLPLVPPSSSSPGVAFTATTDIAYNTGNVVNSAIAHTHHPYSLGNSFSPEAIAARNGGATSHDNSSQFESHYNSASQHASNTSATHKGVDSLVHLELEPVDIDFSVIATNPVEHNGGVSTSSSSASNLASTSTSSRSSCTSQTSHMTSRSENTTPNISPAPFEEEELPVQRVKLDNSIPPSKGDTYDSDESIDLDIEMDLANLSLELDGEPSERPVTMELIQSVTPRDYLGSLL